MTRKSTRRDFLKVSAAAGVGFWAAGGVQAQQRRLGPNDRLNVAIIGSAGRGGGNLRGISELGENIVALCDVDDEHAAGAYRDFPNAAKFHDFRVMLERQRDIDAVAVSTPDHVHAHAAIMAMRLGKHCYCEKPLTHSIWEARQMALVARRYGVATQMGNQGTSSNGLRQGVEIIRSGALGEVREVHVWTNRPIWPQNVPRPAGSSPVPASLNWDLWIGPAPFRPYHTDGGRRGTYAPFNWRGWWDFGTGALGDMACHTMNLANMALRLGAPSSVVADLDSQGSTQIAETAPLGVTVTYEFPARGSLPPVRLYWYERRQPPPEKLMGQTIRANSSGCVIIGSQGTFFTTSDYGQEYRLLPQERFANYQPPAPTLPRSPGHHAEWIAACKGGPPAMSNFVDYAGPFTETVLLGNVAMRVGNNRRITWNSQTLQAVGMPEANQYIRREYRRGWELQGEQLAVSTQGQGQGGPQTQTDTSGSGSQGGILQRIFRRRFR